MKQRRTSKLTILLFGVAVCAALVVKLSGFERKVFQSWFNPAQTTRSEVRHYPLARHADAPDLYALTIREYEPYDCCYTVRDMNHNGSPDAFASLIAKRVACALYDTDEDGSFESQTVGVYEGSNTDLRRIYRDLDLDGRFDAMLRIHEDLGIVAYYLLMNETLVRVASVESRDWREAWIEGPAGTQLRVVFQDGEWQVAG
jgi:hypothetical protein